ncbi:hydrolase [Chloroflexota bacterium]
MATDKLYKESETGCCPRFNPEPWDEKEISFENKLFVKDHVISLFHIPLNFGRVMVRNMTRIEAAGAVADEPLLLSDEKSLWGTDVYMAVSKEVPGADMESISGTYLTKVFEGPYKNSPKWVKRMKEYVESKNREMKRMYFFYTTCPGCAKYYGKNYVVLLSEV